MICLIVIESLYEMHIFLVKQHQHYLLQLCLCASTIKFSLSLFLLLFLVSLWFVHFCPKLNQSSHTSVLISRSHTMNSRFISFTNSLAPLPQLRFQPTLKLSLNQPKRSYLNVEEKGSDFIISSKKMNFDRVTKIKRNAKNVNKSMKLAFSCNFDDIKKLSDIMTIRLSE